MVMWMRFAVHAAVGQILDADQAFYRRQSRNMRIRQFSVASKHVQQWRAVFDTVFQEYRDFIPGWERLRKMADRSLACDALWAVCQAYDRREVAQIPVIELIRYATNSYRGKAFDPEYLRAYFGVSYRMLLGPRIGSLLRSVREKLGLN